MNCHYIRYSLKYFFDIQNSLGIKSVALWGGGPHFRVESDSHSDCSVVRGLAAQAGVKITCFTAASCTYLYQYCAPRESFIKSLDYFTRGLEAASELESPYMVVNSGWGYWNEARDEAWKRSREMLFILAERGRALGVTLTMESLRYAESHLVFTQEDALRMYRDVGHPNLKIMIDRTAAGVAGESTASWFETFGSAIVNTHFVDGSPYGHLVWGDGSIDLKTELMTLAAYDYHGQLGLEITDSRYFDNPAVADARCLAALEPFLS